MAVQLPNEAKDVVSRMQTDVKGELPNSNPWLKASYIKARIQGIGQRIFDHGYLQIKELFKQLSPFTAEGVWLQFWADVKNIVPLTAQAAKGPVTLTGTVSATASAGEVITISGIEYTLDSLVTIAANVKSIGSLTASGGVAFCVTDDDHEFATGKVVTISGANQSEYNGDQVITVTGSKAFTYSIIQGAVPTATGTITASIDSATGQVTADLTTATDGGTETNQDNGAELTLQNTIAGIDDTVTVQWDGLEGGTNDETESEYQTRITDRWGNPLTEFNANRIKKVLKEIDGITRVWVYEPNMGDVVAGEVKIYFVRDNDDSIIPGASEVTEAETAVLAIKPANSDDVDTYTLGATGIDINPVISAVVPNTLSMRNAVKATVRSYYRGGIDEAENHTVDKLKGAITQTYDVEAGERLISFTLDSPTTTESIGQGEIATEGTTTVNN